MSVETDQNSAEAAQQASMRWANDILNTVAVDGEEVHRTIRNETMPIGSPTCQKTMSRWLYEDVHLGGIDASIGHGGEVLSPISCSATLIKSRRISRGWSLHTEANGTIVATSISNRLQILITEKQAQEWVMDGTSLRVPRVRKGFITGWDSISGSNGSPKSPDMRIYIPWIDDSARVELLTTELDRRIPRWMMKFANFYTLRPDKGVLYCSAQDAPYVLDALRGIQDKSQRVGGPGFSIRGPFGFMYALHRDGSVASFGINVAQLASEYLVNQFPRWDQATLANTLSSAAQTIDIRQ